MSSLSEAKQLARKQQVYNTVKAHSTTGITRYDVAAKLTLGEAVVYKILKELQADGLITTWRNSGRQNLWEVTDALSPLKDTRRTVGTTNLTLQDAWLPNPSKDPSPLTLAYDYALSVAACRDSSDTLLLEAHSVLTRILRQYTEVVNRSLALLEDYKLWSSKERKVWLDAESDSDLFPLEHVVKLQSVLYDRLKGVNTDATESREPDKST